MYTSSGTEQALRVNIVNLSPLAERHEDFETAEMATGTRITNETVSTPADWALPRNKTSFVWEH